MDRLIALAAERGFFTRKDARASGLSDREVAATIRAGVWVRIRHGYYTTPDAWTALTPEGRHLVRGRAVLDAMGDSVCLSHVSALVAHGIATWGMDLTRVHVTRLDKGRPRVEGDVVHHLAQVPDDDLTRAAGMNVTSVDRALIEAGSLATAESALVSFDSALHADDLSPDELKERFDRMRHWPRTRHLHVPIRMASPRRESPGESRGFWMFWANNIPAPVCQYEVWEDGILIGTTDFAWPAHGQLGEFDGTIKYTRLLKPGEDASQVVVREKRREDELRRVTDFGMMRFIWSDYDRPGQTCHRLRQRLERKAG
ncbi:type IV toxin-antitoxin system AbiEi family antitoxin domain-containing protein [Nocardioides rotundus]|uniref:type IV toxin-antitoxin system AbiEi family antitoxin domain-containing protein n=1 Tax=Nocardioides rotundus TaxID=1774216 RepID=UPI001CC0247E|nr:type IV toxin-antitoxin system AbiEi family antitoxin domain-containing protein [Nocardioides rotundus]UAL28395.1 type IV toxin-antitoxin system AbiEi family antitoxin domain-containing protein [Nocardioides rotundus]